MTEPDFSPRPDGADAAISAGRRRRTHRQLGGAGAAAAFAVAAVLVTVHPFSAAGGSDSLRVAGDPPASAQSSADPTASPAAGPSSAPSTDPTATPSPGASPGTEGGGSGEPGSGQPGAGPGDPSPAPVPTDGADAPDRVSPPPVESVVPYSAGEDCATQPVPIGGPPEWCARYAGDTQVARGGTASIVVDLCRPSGTGSGEVVFSDEDGVEMQIDSSSTTVWDSRDGRKVAPAHDSETVADGTCIRWTTTWDTRDRDGFRVRPGDYSVTFSIEADSSWTGNYGSISVR